MKSKILFIALYSVTFMFPSIGSVDTAGAETDISHCANLEAIAARPACEAAAHSNMGAPAPFDDGLMGAPAMGVPGMQFGNSTYDGSIKPRVHLDTSTRHKHGIFDLQPFPAVKTM